MPGHIKRLQEMIQIRFFLILILTIFIASCGDHTQEVVKKQNTIDTNRVWSHYVDDDIERNIELEIGEEYAEARKLNNNGVRLLELSYPYPNGSLIKDSLLNEALNNFNKAINEKKDYYRAYYNYAIVLVAKKQYDAALHALEELLEVQESDPGTFLLMGMLYEKSGNVGIAEQQYERALKAYDEKLKTPMTSFQDSLDKDQVLLFLEGKENALERINARLKKDPQNVDLLMAKQSIEQFDREEYFRNF